MSARAKRRSRGAQEFNSSRKLTSKTPWKTPLPAVFLHQDSLSPINIEGDPKFQNNLGLQSNLHFGLAAFKRVNIC